MRTHPPPTQLNCPECKALYEDARIVPNCLDSLCLKCFQKQENGTEMTTGQQHWWVKCVCCDQVHTFKRQEEIQNLKRNFGIQGLVECVKVIGRCQEEEMSVDCSFEGCGREGVCYCQNDATWMCEGCRTTHDSHTFTKNHKVLSKSEMQTTRGPFCESHPKEKPLYCLDCSQVVCEECHQQSHHLVGLRNRVNQLFRPENSLANVTGIMKEVEEKEGILKKERERLEKQLENVREQLKQVQSVRLNFEARQNGMKLLETSNEALDLLRPDFQIKFKEETQKFEAELRGECIKIDVTQIVRREQREKENENQEERKAEERLQTKSQEEKSPEKESQEKESQESQEIERREKERERQEKESQESQESQEKEKQEQERQERERQEKERQERERQEKERQERERQEKERREKEEREKKQTEDRPTEREIHQQETRFLDLKARHSFIPQRFQANPTEVNLNSKKLGDEERMELVSLLVSKSTVLKKLYLKGTKVSDSGAHFLSKALQINSSLQQLGLDENRISDKGALSISSALQTNSSLQMLWLTANKISDAGATAILNGLKENSSLRMLSLKSNQIGDETKEKIRQFQSERGGTLEIII